MDSNPAASPTAVRVNRRKLARAVDLLREGVDAGSMSGASVCVLVGGETVCKEAVGTLDGVRPTSPDTLYDLASITKPVATASSVLALVENGKLLLSQPITDLLGDAAAHLSAVTVLNLLTHTSGLPPWIACYENGFGHNAAVQAILRLPTFAPGTKYAYSCLNFILLHKIVEVASGKSLDAFAHKNVFAPLGLETLGYKPDPTGLLAGIAPTTGREGAEKQNVLLTGIVHDGNARAMGGVSGNAGLFGTAADVATFGASLLPSAKQSLYGKPTLARILATQIPNPDIGAHTLFFFAAGNALCPVGDLLSPRAVGHSGFTGTVLTVDPDTNLSVAVLTNAVFGEGKGGWLRLRRRFLNAVAGSLE